MLYSALYSQAAQDPKMNIMKVFVHRMIVPRSPKKKKDRWTGDNNSDASGKERMVWVVVWVHIHTIKMASGNEIYKFIYKKKRGVDPSMKARDYWGKRSPPP